MKTAAQLMCTLLLFLQPWSPLAAEEDAIPMPTQDQEITYIDDEEDPHQEESAADEPKEIQQQVQLQFFPSWPRWYAPYLGTEDWAHADYGLGGRLLFKVPDVSSTELKLDVGVSTLGYDGLFSTSLLFKTTVELVKPNGLSVLGGATAFLDLDLPSESFGEILAGLTLAEHASGIPWKGYWFSMDTVFGFNETAWLITNPTASYTLRAGNLALFGALSGVFSVISDAPLRRLPRIDGYYAGMAPSWPTGDLDPEQVSGLLMTGVLKFRGDIPLFDMVTDTQLAGPLLSLGVGGLWTARGETDEEGNTTMAHQTGLILNTSLQFRQKLNNSDSERREPVLSLELVLPFSSFTDTKTWRLSLIGGWSKIPMRALRY